MKKKGIRKRKRKEERIRRVRGGRERRKDKKGKRKPESNSTLAFMFLRRMGFLPYWGIQSHWIFKGLYHPVIIYELQDCKSSLYDLGAWIRSSGTSYMIQLSLRSSPFPILDASPQSFSLLTLTWNSTLAELEGSGRSFSKTLTF